jgi:hypothetical protein
MFTWTSIDVVEVLIKIASSSWRHLNVPFSGSIQVAERLDDRDSILGGGWKFFLPHQVQTRSGTHPASYPMGAGGYFPGCKEVRGVKLTPQSNAEVKQVVELYLYSRNMSSWRGG